MDYTRSLSRLYEGGLKDNRYLKDRYGLPQNPSAASLSGGGLAEAEAVTVTGGSSCKSSRRRGGRPSTKLKVGAASSLFSPAHHRADAQHMSPPSTKGHKHDFLQYSEPSS